MQILLVLLGTALLIVMVVDVVWTALAVSAGRGSVTGALGRGLWALALRLGSGHRRLQLTGHLSGGTAGYVLLLWQWLFVLFSSDPLAVVDSTTQRPASALARLAFAGGP